MKPSPNRPLAQAFVIAALTAAAFTSQNTMAHKVKTVTVHKHNPHHSSHHHGSHHHNPSHNSTHQLPKVHHKFSWKGLGYFVAGGLFYRHIDGHYSVVAAPFGAHFNELPGKAKVIVIDKRSYHLVHGQYYRYNRKHQHYVLVQKPHSKRVKVVAHY